MATTISVWLPVAMALGWAPTGPVPTAEPTSAGTDCHLETFYLSPREMEAFKKARDALVLAQPTAAPRIYSHPLFRWLQRLNQATKKESPICLQTSVTFGLFRLLIRDLRCVARPELCA
ncbi:Interleukin-28B [Fukomys damarensis]|uniref:Interleukin-28B n=1 Tax=Fukomys damarensis TaxID=885580 RepID=A0A091CPC4_FUKDA|nr:Interleukin-28B [Fukomys damarensis]